MGLLYMLFKNEGHAAEKKKILRESYDVDLDADEIKEMDDMCNLSVGVFSRGLEEGLADPVKYIRKLAEQENIPY